MMGICPNCGGTLEIIGYEQGVQCDTCSYKMDGAFNVTIDEGDMINNENHKM